MREALDQVASEVARTMLKLPDEQLEELAKLIRRARRVFVSGQGRSGLVARAFAIRLMHLGKSVFVAGEAATPAIRKGDLLVACSASGTTETTRAHAAKAKAAGATVAAVTANGRSALAREADHVVRIPMKPELPIQPNGRSIQFATTLFEQCSLLALDAVCLLLARRMKRTDKSMKSRHANLE